MPHPKSNTRLLHSFSLLGEAGVQNENKAAMMMNLLRRKCWGHKIFHPNAFSKETARNNHPKKDKVKRRRVIGYQGPKVSRVKVVLGSQEML